MGVGSDRIPKDTERGLADLVVGLDGSAASAAALRWAVTQLGPAGRVHAAHVVAPAEELALDAALGDSVRLLHHREAELHGQWIPNAVPGEPGARVEPVLREGAVAGELLRLGDEVGADAIVVGHHAQSRHGPRIVGHVTAKLLRSADRPVVIVPLDWDPARTCDRPVAVGVGGSRATEVALRWTLAHPGMVRHGLLLAHAYGPRTMLRPEGWLDVLAYHLDPTVLPAWVEEDLLELAEELQAETGTDVEVTVSVQPGRTGPRLVDAGEAAGLLVVGRAEPPFIRSTTIAPYLRHAIVHSPCPVVVVPAPDR
jgi:nucleotide-binding universal stress UspA family protein